MDPRRLAAILMIALLVIFTSCSSDDGPTGPGGDDPTDVLAAATLGPDGGWLGSDDVSLSVPAGALAQDTDLAIVASEEMGPFSQDVSPVYQLEGLPAELAGPVTLRFRHSLADHDTLSCWFGEPGEAFNSGETTSWQQIACSDSAGWCVAELDRGAQLLGSKAGAPVQATAARTLRTYQLVDGHFRVVFDPVEIPLDWATDLAAQMEYAYLAHRSVGFVFGDAPGMWPREARIGPSDRALAEYVCGPHGLGRFNFTPDAAATAVGRRMTAYHEVLHCAQQVYDPRPPEQWGALNHGRDWLDEGSATFVEATVSGGLLDPLSMEADRFLAPLAGVVDHPDLTGVEFGYGMYLFFVKLANVQPDAMLELYEEFARTGDATLSLRNVLDPPLSSWCTDFQRNVVKGDLMPLLAAAVYWYGFAGVGNITSDIGTGTTWQCTVPDYGSSLHRYRISAGSDQNTGLEVKTSGGYDLTLYAWNYEAETPQLIATGTDSLMYVGFDDLPATYESVYVQVTNPRHTQEDWNGEVTVDVSIDVVDTDLDLERFDRCAIVSRLVAHMDDGSTVPWEGFYVSSTDNDPVTVTWDGSEYRAEWDVHEGDHHYWGFITCTVNVPNDGLASYEADYQWARLDNLHEYRIVGTALPLGPDQYDDVSIVYRLDGAAACGSITLYEERVSDGGVTESEVVSFSCDADSYIEIRLEDTWDGR